MLISMLLGAAVIVVGLQFRSAVQSAQSSIIGGLLIATGVGFSRWSSGQAATRDAASGPRPRPRLPTTTTLATTAAPRPRPTATIREGGRCRRSSPSAVERSARWRGVAAYGAVRRAASPDLTILPVFLAATTAGLATAVGSLLIFGAVDDRDDRRAHRRRRPGRLSDPRSVARALGQRDDRRRAGVIGTLVIAGVV